jgi:hypothetical protein
VTRYGHVSHAEGVFQGKRFLFEGERFCGWSVLSDDASVVLDGFRRLTAFEEFFDASDAA